MKYDIKSCEYLSLAGMIEARLFDNWVDYSEKIVSHPAFLKTSSLEKINDKKMIKLKGFMYHLCGTNFAMHQLYAVTPDAFISLKNGADSYFAINKIHE